MTRLTQHPTARFVVTILFTLVAAWGAITLYQQHGFSALWLLLCFATLMLFVSLVTQFRQPHKQLDFVLKSLANGDGSLGLNRHHPMFTQLEEIKVKLQNARFNAQQQAYFLQSLLLHIEFAVLVCDDSGKVIESNPATIKLLGKSIEHSRDLAHIATLIAGCETSLKSITTWQHGEQQDILAVQISTVQIQGNTRKIITLNSIRDALQNKEQQAYKRLTKVLTHEVANSITPLASIAQSCEALLPESLTFNEAEDKQDLALALRTLAKRTEYLGSFIARFRQVSSLPTPTLAPQQLVSIVEGVYQLHLTTCAQANIQLHIETAPTPLVMLDGAQIEQVLINLTKNAIEAVQQAAQYQAHCAPPSIVLTTGCNSAGQYYIDVSDNGPGVAAHVIEMMFVPFFTTKQQGSGIGLSLSRQIMQNHDGDLIYLQRERGACFRCLFG